MKPTSILISGGGIAGLTLAVLLKRLGWQPTVIERNAAPSTEGYMMDFFGTGWDVAERMGLLGDLNAIHYPIKRMEFVDTRGAPYITVPIEQISRALSHRYLYLRRPDLERILHDRARNKDIDILFGRTIERLSQQRDHVDIEFSDGERAEFALIVGADGIHSRVRELAFGPADPFQRYLGYYVAAFHFPDYQHELGNALKIHEEPDRLAALYPLGNTRSNATYLFRHNDAAYIPPNHRMDFLRRKFFGTGWIVERILDQHTDAEPLFFDSVTQIVMPRWHQGRIALIGDACGCLTLLAGQGSHMAMAGAWVLANELDRCETHEQAFAAYQRFLKPHVDKRQRDTAWYSKYFVPSERSRPWLRRLTIDLLFSEVGTRVAMGMLGAKSALDGYR